jgi:hypothetical protein
MRKNSELRLGKPKIVLALEIISAELTVPAFVSSLLAQRPCTLPRIRIRGFLLQWDRLPACQTE